VLTSKVSLSLHEHAHMYPKHDLWPLFHGQAV
jgi:hypothetical protein